MGLMQSNDPRAIRAREEHAQKMFDASLSKNTRINYRSDLYKFKEFVWQYKPKHIDPLPADPVDIVKYLNHQAKFFNPRTLDRHLKAIRYWHKINDFIDPTKDPRVDSMRKGIKNTYSTPLKKAKAFSLDDMHVINNHYKDKKDLHSARNNALMQLGFFGAFRRSELVNIRIEDLSFSDEGVTILLPRSKTDQEGLGESIGIPVMKGKLCAVKVLNHWITVSGIKAGYIFCPINKSVLIRDKPINCDTLYHMVKALALDCGFEEPELYSGHSMRRGCATEAARNGASMHSIMKHGRWKNINTVAGYIEDACKFKDNAASFLDVTPKK